MWESATTAGPTTPQFYEAILLGIVLLSPKLLTLAVAANEAHTRRTTATHPAR